MCLKIVIFFIKAILQSKATGSAYGAEETGPSLHSCDFDCITPYSLGQFVTIWKVMSNLDMIVLGDCFQGEQGGRWAGWDSLVSCPGCCGIVFDPWPPPNTNPLQCVICNVLYQWFTALLVCNPPSKKNKKKQRNVFSQCLVEGIPPQKVSDFSCYEHWTWLIIRGSLLVANIHHLRRK